jgi:hypothetical protein
MLGDWLRCGSSKTYEKSIYGHFILNHVWHNPGLVTVYGHVTLMSRRQNSYAKANNYNCLSLFLPLTFRGGQIADV